MAGKKEKRIQSAAKQLQKGQYEKALAEFSRILREDPEDTEILLKASELQVKLGQHLRASETLFRLGVVFGRQENHFKAVSSFLSVLKLDPNCIDAHQHLVNLYLKMGMQKDARNQLEILGDHYGKQGVVGQSLDAYRRLVQLDPDNIASLLKLAEICSSLAMTADAIACFTRAADKLKESGKLQEYVKVLERLIYHDVNNFEALKELANIYMQLGDIKAALGKLQAAYRLNTRDIEVLEMLCQAFLAVSQPLKAIQILKVVATIFQEDHSMDMVQKTYQRILEIDPSDVDARTFLAT
ncbi:MAG: tetratricopeptide repeat protein [Deltaproteobacteria bacterium]|nr:tetratricopeptide repeat protein [Deltaproteobacteria bacterium]MBW1870634.1 tetratricopeptide repeat protein [Deltaproteobacteria bacterium]